MCCCLCSDPLLTALYATHFVRAVQGVDPSGRGYLQAASTPKHYAGYNLDNWHGMDRYHYNAVINKQDWADTYSQPFWAAIAGGNASGLMCSYNAMTLAGYPSTGVPTCADPKILTEYARGELQFDGYITGDCGAAEDVWTAHHFGGDAAGAAAASLTAGMDVDCGNFVSKNGMAALKSGKLSSGALDKAVSHLFRLRIRLGYFDPPEKTPWGNASYAQLNYTEHYSMALRAAREGIVLLSHRHEVLPLRSGTKIVVSGPNAANAANMQGIDCHGVPPFLITPVQGISNYSEVNYPGPGCSIKSKDTSGFANVTSAVKNADAVVLVLGLDPSVEYEMRDRSDLLLPGVQSAFVKAVRSSMGPEVPLILALMGGGVMDTSELDDLVDAVLWVGYPGQSGGKALADILFGAVPPSGRSPLTWYKNAYASDASSTAVSMLDMNMRPAPSHMLQARAGPYPPHGPNPGRTYRFLTEPETFQRYPFGHGLTYGASFAYKSVHVSPPTLKSVAIKAAVTGLTAVHTRFNGAETVATVDIQLSNIGTLSADHSVLLFAVPPNAGQDGTPLRSLVAFERVRALAPGSHTTVTIKLTAWSVALADSEGAWGPVVGQWQLIANNGTVDGSSETTDIIVEA